MTRRSSALHGNTGKEASSRENLKITGGIMIGISRKQVEHTEYIFVDFFDTLMFRSVHSCQMTEAWDRALARKLELAAGKLRDCRRAVLAEAGRDECAVNSHTLCGRIWEKLKHASENVSPGKEDFCKLSLETETYLEFGVQYVNREIFRFLDEQKKQGKKIILVTDFYLPAESYHRFLKKCGPGQLADQIFCSSDIGLTKSGDGLLYGHVLKTLDITPAQAVMIGDSLQADKLNAERYGIRSFRYFPFIHKVRTNLSRILKRDGSRSCYKTIRSFTRKDLMFLEYVFPLSCFTERLYDQLRYDRQNSAYFLSRGGYYLKILFDAYEAFCVPEKETIRTQYLYNSRKVNILAEKDEEARSLLTEYLAPYTKGNSFSFVDEGWYGHGQLIYTRTLGLKTAGYYLGLMDNFPETDCQRKGILFHVDENGRKSPYYGIFRTNCTLYEQLLTAPHGSVEAYVRGENQEITAVLKDNEQERRLYSGYTKAVQDHLLDYAKALFVWQCPMSLYQIAVQMIRPLLFAGREKRKLLKIYDGAYYNNAQDDSKKEFGKLKQVRINVIQLLYKPEEYMRYFCKVKERCTSDPAYALYIPFGMVVYGYCRLSLFLKRCFERED